MDRRSFVKGAVLAGAVAASGLIAAGCDSGAQSGPDGGDGAKGELGEQRSADAGREVVAPEAERELPRADPDPESDYGIDRAINIAAIDEWLGRDDVAYRDVRMLFDPADFASIGGDSDLTATVEGFKVVPFPLLATLPPLPVAGAYDGPAAWVVEWADDGGIASVGPAYWESMQLLEDLFPKDKAIFLMCGAGAYAAFAKQLLIHLGWDDGKIYNIGGFWSYAGARKVDLIVSSKDTDDGRLCLSWRADVAPIDFARMHER